MARGELATALGLLLRNRLALAGAVVYLAFVLIAVAAPLLAPADPEEQILTNRFKPPAWLSGDGTHPLGADNLGRDVLSRLVYGSRVSIAVGLVTVTICAVVGSALGAIAGYARGRVDGALMLLLDIWMAFPALVLAIAVSAALGPGLPNLILALALTGWVSYCRVIRGEVLALREREFVQASIGVGASNRRIIFSEILPNVITTVIVFFPLMVALNMLTEAALSFLSIGVQPPNASWGTIILDGQELLYTRPVVAIAPGIAIAVTVLALNVLGDGVREALDPRARLRGRL
jgi:ABC-type dipeptide/oligopeptide/nickel transport system permease subunit